jgi:uncharacterized protein YegP (UPF0339 family)
MTKRTPKFLVRQDVAGQWRWHLVAINGLIVCQGESHPTKQKALRAAEGIKRLAAAACVAVDAPAAKPAVKKAEKPAVKKAVHHAAPAGKPVTKRTLDKPAVKKAATAPDAKPVTKRVHAKPVTK